jgi:quercetin dioxygenase-like cupin family protein
MATAHNLAAAREFSMNARDLVTDSDAAEVLSFPWGTLRWLCNDQLQPGAEQTVGICHIHPGQRNPVHYHPNCEEVLYMLAGSGDHSFDGEVVTLRPGSVVRIPAGMRHNLANTGAETIVCLICFSSPDRQTVFLE